jgi:AraC family transcriptional regulator
VLAAARQIKRAGALMEHHRGVTATDSFHDFVDQLADALADGAAVDGTGDQWAARLHFSRFHFDRMISSVAGEPPGAFRRRILLERAAYRMITTTAPLLDIAVEAGYGSHEAFTRAFTRAYGVAPAAWRRKPSQIRIAAPSGVHFHPPGSLRLPARPSKKVTSMDLLTAMVEHHVWLTGEMIRVAGRLTDEQLDQPIELDVDDDPQTIRSLLSRLVGQMGMWNAIMADREYDWSIEEHESLASLRERLAVEGQTYLTHVRDVVHRDALDETFVDACGDQPYVFTYGGNIAHVVTFAAHRRTLVVLALSRHGVDELGWGDPMRFVGESAG